MGIHCKRQIIVLLLVSAGLLFSLNLPARDFKYSLQTNAFQWADFGTLNLEGSAGFSRHFSAHLEGRYNPWKFKAGPHDRPVFNNQRTLAAGVRWWPWYVFSGWWVGTGIQFSDYATSGILRHAMNTGKALGAQLSAGYTFMLSKHFNIDVGAGVWMGRILDYRLYCCPDRHHIRESGDRNFFGVNDIDISLVYVF